MHMHILGVLSYTQKKPSQKISHFNNIHCSHQDFELILY